MASKSARELAKKTSDAQSPAPKLLRSGEAASKDIETKQEHGTAAASKRDAGPTSLAQVLATFRGKMADTNKNLMRNELLEVRGSIEMVCERVDDMQGSVDRALAPLAKTVERHDTTLLEHEENIKALDARVEVQAAALEQMRLEVLSLRAA